MKIVFLINSSYIHTPYVKERFQFILAKRQKERESVFRSQSKEESRRKIHFWNTLLGLNAGNDRP